jgi:VWFA-related protein
MFVCGPLLCVSSAAQQPSPTPTPEPDVIRVQTDLVQTDVMVFDKAKTFVGGLKSDQLELSIDGKPQQVSFFEQVKIGSSREAQMHVGTQSVADAPKATVSERPRTVVFFIDDLHLSPSSLERTRRTLQHFIETDMNENDQVAIASSSGDLGFLQQFTDNREVLRAATDRLTYHPYKVGDMTDSRTPMSEYTAVTLERKDDPGVLDFYIDRCLQEAYPLRYRRESCEAQVKSRARLILLQASSVILNTYAALESLMRAAAMYSGRKLVFFFSDGFLLDTGPRNSDPREKLNEIADGALRAGVVIYTIDARGLFSGQLDATNNVAFDRQNRLESVSLREGPASQDALNALAGDTGGRALRNQNYFDRWVNTILDETSQYYVLAWRPNSAEQTARSFRNVSVRVIDHPEYSVRLARGVFNLGKTAPAVKTETEINTPAKTHIDLQKALTDLNPKHDIPASLGLVYLDTPQRGAVLTASVRIANEALSYESDKGKPTATVDLAGVVVNDRGKPAGSFQTRLNINSLGKDGNLDDTATFYNSRHPLPPGLYQMRIAARDLKSGRVGSAQQWIQIPDLKSRRLTLSSLLLGLQSVTAGGSNAPQVQFSVDHRFTSGANLGFMAFVYNADQGQSSPKISFQARILKNAQEVRAIKWATLSGAPADRSRIICGGQIPLNGLSAGHYTLELKVTDDVSKVTASAQTRITIE